MCKYKWFLPSIALLMSFILIGCGSDDDDKNETPAEISVTTLDFMSFDDQEAALENDGLRVFGPNALLSDDVEPEYVAISADSKTAWVSLQENNGIAKIDLVNKVITDIFPLGYKNYGVVGNEIDASDEDGDAVNLRTWENVFGMYQPDGIASFEENSTTYIVSANEGDAREYDGFEEETRVEDVTLDVTAFPNAATIQAEDQLGRLIITQNVTSDTAATEFTELVSFGARSFSIWNGETGELVFDSGSDLATQAVAAGVYPDGRSDAKGTEPENVDIGYVAGKRLAFIGLERADAVAVYDITDINAVMFQQMLVTADDDAPEGILFIDAADSPSGSALLIVSNENSGNITVYQSDATGTFSSVSRLELPIDDPTVDDAAEGAAEISAFDPNTNSLFVINNAEGNNNARIDVVDLTDVTSPVVDTNMDVSSFGGGINSVAVANGRLAAAIEGAESTDAGSVVIFDTTTLQVEEQVTVGSLPDMVAFTPDGSMLITADEGEPNDDYSIDPQGTISIITLP